MLGAGALGTRGKAREWLRRYVPAEAAAIVGAVSAGLIVSGSGQPAATAYAAAIGESLAFYAVILLRDRADSHSGWWLTLRRLVLEFGPAELLDTFAVRPLTIYLATGVVGNVVAGVVLGKVAADIVFYAVAIVGYEAGKALTATGTTAPAREPEPPAVDPLEPAALDRLPHPTPFLLMDLARVEAAYRSLLAALGVDALHYAVKCNPDPRLLRGLADWGCRFEVASYAELDLLRGLGIDSADVLYSNPVKPAEHVRRAYAAGCWRFAADSSAELAKVADHAPGAAVYVRTRTAGASTVPSEGKFGVDHDRAYALLLEARERGLRPYGLTFHVGSQMTRPSAWADAIRDLDGLMRRLLGAGVRLELLDIGGGFPARYDDSAGPSTSECGRLIGEAVAGLPYRPSLVAEPGRGLVAEAGVIVSTVIGTAERAGATWLHLDVGAFNGMMEALETRNALRFPLSDSRRAAVQARYHVTGPSCDSQDTILFDASLSAGIVAGDRIYLGTAGAYTTAYASAFNGFDVPVTRYPEPVAPSG